MDQKVCELRAPEMFVTGTPLPRTFPPALVTVSETVVACDAELPAPVTVSVYVPAAALEATEIDRVDELPETTDAGESVAVTPDGAPETVSETVCALPLVVAVLIVALPEPPWRTEIDDGLTETLKSFPTGGLETMHADELFDHSFCTV